MSGSSNIDGIIYTHPQHGVDSKGHPDFDLSKVVASKYLKIGGQKVPDPYFTISGGGSNQNTLYSRLNSDGTVDKSSVIKNGGNYLIVPADYDISEEVRFAAHVNAVIASVSKVSPALGEEIGKAWMAWNFWPYGNENIQRGTKWGIPSGDTNPVFKDAASWSFGFVTQQVNIPKEVAERGGGELNRDEYGLDRLLKRLDKRIRVKHKIPDGLFGLSMGDELNFEAGVRAAEALGFHKAIIEHTQLNLGSFAPYFRGERLNAGHAKPGRHSADNGVHAAIMTAMSRSPVSQVEASRVSPKVLGLSTAKSKIGFGQSPQSLGDISASLSAYPSPFAALKRPLAGGQDPFRDATSAAPDLVQPQARKARDPISDDLFGGSQSRVSELPSFAPGKANAGQIGASSSRNARLLEEGGTFSPGAKVRSAERVVSKKAAAGRSLDDRDDEGPMAPHRYADVTDDRWMDRRLSDFFDRQSRLPPSGGTGFDPRLSPAWPGLKLPA